MLPNCTSKSRVYFKLISFDFSVSSWSAMFVLLMLPLTLCLWVQWKVIFTPVLCYLSHQSNSHLLYTEALQNLIFFSWNNCLRWAKLIIATQERILCWLWEQRQLCCLWLCYILDGVTTTSTVTHTRWIYLLSSFQAAVAQTFTLSLFTVLHLPSQKARVSPEPCLSERLPNT